MASARHTRASYAQSVEAANSSECAAHGGGERGSSKRGPGPSRRGKGSTSKSNGNAGSGEASENGDGQEDEEDGGSGNAQSAADDDEDDDPEAVAPSGGLGKGKGRRPVSSTDPVSCERGRTRTLGRRAGLSKKSDLDFNISYTRKRPLNDDDADSVLRDDADSDAASYPRRKIARRAGDITDDETAAELDDEPSPIIPEVVDEADDIADDDDYRGVDLISDSEDDEPDLEKLEEQAIIESEDDLGPSGRASLSDLDSDDDYATGMDQIPGTDNHFFEEQFHRGQPHALSEEAVAADSDKHRRKQSGGSGRKVHFDDEVRTSDTASSFSTEHDLSLYPELTMLESGHAALEATSANHDASVWQVFQRSRSHSGSDGSGSYWDFHEDIPPADPGTESEFEMGEYSSSGYESDTGETTDEDLPPETTVHTPGALLHRRPSEASSDTSGGSHQAVARPKRSLSRQHKPKLATWTVDPEKTIAVIDATGKRMLLFPARAPRANNFWTESTASTISNQSPRTPFQALLGDEGDPSDFSSQSMATPDIMFNGIFAPSLFGNQIVGPPEAFYPFTNFDADGEIIPSDDGMEMDDLSDREPKMSLKDIIDCGDDTEDELTNAEPETTTTTTDAADATDILATPSSSSFAAQVSPTLSSAQFDLFARRNSAEHWLTHFNRPIVNSFRANQDRCRRIYRQPQLHGLRTSMTRPLRNGRASDTLITPVRKRRGHMGSVDLQRSPIGKPLAGTSGRGGHRRNGGGSI